MKKTEEVSTETTENNVEEVVRDSSYYHGIIVKIVIVLMVSFFCYMCSCIYHLTESFRNIYMESLFKAFFLILFEIMFLLYKNNYSKSFGILGIINSLLVIILTFLFGQYEIIYVILSLVLLVSSIKYVHVIKKEEPSEEGENVADKGFFISLIPLIVALVVFSVFVFFKKKLLFSILIGLMFISAFNVAGIVICYKYMNKNKLILRIIDIVFLAIYLVFGILSFVL